MDDSFLNGDVEAASGVSEAHINEVLKKYMKSR